MLLACRNSSGFLEIAKKRSVLVKDRSSFKNAYLKALGDDWLFEKDGKTHFMVGGLLFFYPGIGLELNNMEKGRIVLPRGRFWPPARRACGRGERP
jgi:hypothetical protein